MEAGCSSGILKVVCVSVWDRISSLLAPQATIPTSVVLCVTLGSGNFTRSFPCPGPRAAGEQVKSNIFYFASSLAW